MMQSARFQESDFIICNVCTSTICVMASIFTRSGPFRLPVNEFVIEFYAETLFWESEVE